MTPGGAGDGGEPSGARVRLFVALELPAEIQTALAGWAAARLVKLPALRPVGPESLHVTLCFLGSRPAQEVGEIAAACRVAGQHPAPALTLGEPLWLPHRRPNVLTIGVSEEGGAPEGGRLAAVRSDVARALQAGGFLAPDRRPFLAHVTVARVRARVRQRPVELPAPESRRFTAAAVTLFRSRLGGGPARYERLETVTLPAPRSPTSAR